MRPLVARAADVLREEGPVALAGQATRYGSNQAIAWLRSGYWRLRGDRPVTVGDVTCHFEVGTLHESRELEFLVDNELPVAAEILGALEEGDVFYDIGAHVGFYSCLGGLRDAEVVAFEPYPPNVERLRANLSRNGLSATVKPVALSNETGSVGFDQPNSDTPGWSRSAISTDDPGLTVPAEAGDRLVAADDLPIPTVVKIDVEGAEGRVIDGLYETLSAEGCRLVYCEIHRPRDHRQSVRDFGDTTDDVRSMFGDMGFSVEPIHDRGPELTIRAIK